MAPDDSAFKLAAKWAISMPRILQSSTISNVFLRIAYTGDVARLSVEGVLLDDNFNNGLPWTIGLRRFTPKIGDGPLELSILPLRRDAPIFFEKRFRPSFDEQETNGGFEERDTDTTIQVPDRDASEVIRRSCSQRKSITAIN